MNAVKPDLLADLRDIHLPEAISFWPPAPGVWIVLALVIALGFSVHLLLRARRRSLARAALGELASIEQDFRQHEDSGRLALSLSTLLRRVALTRFGRREVASLFGDEWSDFLRRTSGRSASRPEVAGSLAIAIYAGHAAGDIESTPDEWIDSVRHWIRENT